MKAGLLFCLFNLVFLFPAFAQPGGAFSNVPALKKGSIILMDGSQVWFGSLVPMTDSVSVTTIPNGYFTFKASEIYQIRKSGNYLATGLISGGCTGLLYGVMLARSAGKMADAFLTLFTFTLAKDADIRRQETSIILISTLSAALIGGTIGYFIKKEKVLYQNPLTLGFRPDFTVSPGNEPILMITCTINLR